MVKDPTQAHAKGGGGRDASRPPLTVFSQREIQTPPILMKFWIPPKNSNADLEKKTEKKSDMFWGVGVLSNSSKGDIGKKYFALQMN